jgi:hypothetical protein
MGNELHDQYKSGPYSYGSDQPGPYRVPPQPQPPNPKRRRWLVAPAAVVGGLLLIGIGATIGDPAATSTKPVAAAPTVTVTATPAPAPTITLTLPAKPAPTVTTTTTVKVATVPQACLEALTYAETGFDLAATAITAAGEFDVDTLTKTTARVNRLAPKWLAAKEACRSAAAR